MWKWALQWSIAVGGVSLHGTISLTRRLISRSPHSGGFLAATPLSLPRGPPPVRGSRWCLPAGAALWSRIASLAPRGNEVILAAERKRYVSLSGLGALSRFCSVEVRCTERTVPCWETHLCVWACSKRRLAIVPSHLLCLRLRKSSHLYSHPGELQ